MNAETSLSVKGTVLTVQTKVAALSLNATGQRGPKGLKGDRGEVGPIADVDAGIPDWTVIFENKLV